MSNLQQHRLNAEHCKEMLSQRASQFRAIQRRLLTRFKDKTPAPLQNLDTLLEGTYRQLLHLAETIQENDLQLEVASNALACATNLFNFILKLWTNMSEEEFSVLQASVTPLVVDTLEAVSKVSNLFILIFLRSIVKQVIRIYINHSRPLILDGIHLIFEQGLKTKTYPYMLSANQEVYGTIFIRSLV